MDMNEIIHYLCTLDKIHYDKEEFDIRFSG